MNTTVLSRFLRYVQVDTQSDPSSTTYPSTAKQKNLGKILVEELLALGVDDAHMDEFGYVYATIHSNVAEKIPTICFCSHMDTSPDCSGTDVQPIVHQGYQGQDLVLPKDHSIVIRLADHPDLKDQFGNDIVTASGDTLLGADNKAGLAAIMHAVQYWMHHPEALHGNIRILFTPDEEIGRGVDKVDMKKLAADFGYTIDGEKLGSMEDETFSADSAEIVIEGVSAHPGFAKGRLENALKIAGDILHALPKDSFSPETTHERQGFVHPVSFSGNAELAKIQFILRDFSTENLKDKAQLLQTTMDFVLANYPNSKATLHVKEQYRNMKEILQHHPQVVAFAERAIQEVGLTPIKSSIRGGTDGSRLSFMGLPCPNLFAGEHAFHSKQEWVSVQDMEYASKMIVRLAQIWATDGQV